MTVLVLDDGARGTLRSVGKARYGNMLGLDLLGPDLQTLAAAYGVPSERAHEPEDLERLLREAVDATGPRLVEVPGAWQMPPPDGS